MNPPELLHTENDEEDEDKQEHWMAVFSCFYFEYTNWHGRNWYRRTVGFDQLVWC